MFVDTLEHKRWLIFCLLFVVKPYERMNLEELKEAEDDFDEADRKAIEMYRYSKTQCL